MHYSQKPRKSCIRAGFSVYYDQILRLLLSYEIRRDLFIFGRGHSRLSPRVDTLQYPRHVSEAGQTGANNTRANRIRSRRIKYCENALYFIFCSRKLITICATITTVKPPKNGAYS